MPIYSYPAEPSVIYLGDCYNDPNNSFVGNPLSTLSADITAFLTAAGVQFQNVVSQATIDTWANPFKLFEFSKADDSIIKRYSIGVGPKANAPVTASRSTSSVCLYDDTASFLMGMSPTALFSTADTNTTTTPLGADDSLIRSDIFVAGWSDGNAVALFFARTQFSTNTIFSYFAYAGQLIDGVTTYNYYSANPISRSIMLRQNGSTGPNSRVIDSSILTRGGHYINGTRKVPLNASYSITCSDAQTPTATWNTDCPIFDDNATLGANNTAIGGLGVRMGNASGLLTGTGSANLGTVTKIQGSVFPGNGLGSKAIIPVGWLNGKILGMRCYSSVI